MLPGLGGIHFGVFSLIKSTIAFVTSVSSG